MKPRKKRAKAKPANTKTERPRVVRGPQLELGAWVPHRHNYIPGACECGITEPRCNQCGAPIPETRGRDPKTFGGYGRPRELCGDACRQRWSRAQRAG